MGEATWIVLEGGVLDLLGSGVVPEDDTGNNLKIRFSPHAEGENVTFCPIAKAAASGN
jgi:hypothetical protein